MNKYQEAYDAYVRAGQNYAAASRELGVARSTIQDRVTRFNTFKPDWTGTWTIGDPPDKIIDSDEPEEVYETASDEAALTKLKYEDQIAALKKQLKASMRNEITTDTVRKLVFGLKDVRTDPPTWVTSTRKAKGNAVPTLILSDLHWGEVVAPKQNSQGNSYNLAIATERLAKAFDRAIYLCTDHIVNKNCPGIVVPLGGDMLSGSIHEELAESNELSNLELVLHLADQLEAGIRQLLTVFPNVYLPCMYGNHGRDSHKPRYKDAAFHNLDWLLYTILERAFKDDKRVQFNIGEGFDVIYRVYNTTFALTHGDRLGAGSGSLPARVSIGANKIKSQYAAEGILIDWVLMGHFHSVLVLDHPGVMVNGSPKGGDEYANGNRMTQGRPAQIIFWTDPEHGVTFHSKVFLDDPKIELASWVSWPNTEN